VSAGDRDPDRDQERLGWQNRNQAFKERYAKQTEAAA